MKLLVLVLLPLAAGCTVDTGQPLFLIVEDMTQSPRHTLDGERVEVHLRRDALGLSNTAPVGIEQGGPYSDSLKVTGKVVGQSASWMVIQRDDESLVHVPREVVLSIIVVAPE